jgi:hypothetical protein
VARADQWVLLAYRVRREPSTPRIALWRKLKRLGVAQLLDGLVALPLDSRNREQLEWIADEVVELGGEASVWIATPGGAAQARGPTAARARADPATRLLSAARARGSRACRRGARRAPR